MRLNKSSFELEIYCNNNIDQKYQLKFSTGPS